MAKRKDQIALSIRAMLIHANTPDSFWAEAMATAVYLKNRLPSESIGDDIPFQRWFHVAAESQVSAMVYQPTLVGKVR
jgi:hypothetical protein